jgi:hypothetical protein
MSDIFECNDGSYYTMDSFSDKTFMKLDYDNDRCFMNTEFDEPKMILGTEVNGMKAVITDECKYDFILRAYRDELGIVCSEYGPSTNLHQYTDYYTGEIKYYEYNITPECILYAEQNITFSEMFSKLNVDKKKLLIKQINQVCMEEKYY